SIRTGNGTGYFDRAINREIAQVAERLGDNGLAEVVSELTRTITIAGFAAPFDGALSPQLIQRLRAVFEVGAIRLLAWADELGEIPNIEVLRLRKGVFPIAAIKHKRKVLSLFGALL